jgi:hypothetical protein
MNLNLFTCSTCLIQKEISQLGGEINLNSQKLATQKENYEAEITKLATSQFTATSLEKKAELERNIQQKVKELENVVHQIKIGKEQICLTCWKKFEKKDISTFICVVCKQNITGKKYEGHIRNFQDEGVEVNK